jgi:hypothetical protein
MSGIKYDGDKPDMSLLPPAALLDEALCWTKGKRKYDAFNWHKGLKYRRVLAAVARHWTLLNAGIDIDEETKCHHASAIRCGMGMLVTFHLEGRKELDDRLQLSDEVKAKLQSMSQGESIWEVLADVQPLADAQSLRNQVFEAIADEQAKQREADLNELANVMSDETAKQPAELEALSALFMDAAKQGYKIP